MLKIQMVSFILCLLGAFKANFVVEVSMQNKKSSSAGTYHKKYCVSYLKHPAPNGSFGQIGNIAGSRYVVLSGQGLVRGLV